MLYFQVNDFAVALHRASRNKSWGAYELFSMFFKEFTRDNKVYKTKLILKRDKENAFSGTGPLSYDDQTAREDLPS